MKPKTKKKEEISRLSILPKFEPQNLAINIFERHKFDNLRVWGFEIESFFGPDFGEED